MQALENLAKHFGFSMSEPWRNIEPEHHEKLLYGTGDETVKFVYEDDSRRYQVEKPFEGVIGNIERRWRETDSAWMREELGKFQSSATCESCNGNRLKAEALAVKIAGKHVGEITILSVSDALKWFRNLPAQLNETQSEIADRVLKEVIERLGFLNNVGLDYLNLSRSSRTLSGGESPTHSTGVANRIGTDRRVICAG